MVRTILHIDMDAFFASVLACDPGQISLFSEDRRRQQLIATMDLVNDRYGVGKLFWGTLLERDHHRPVISPAWRPKGTKQYC